MIRYLTTYLVPDFSLREEWAEWPDLAIFESFCQQLSLQKYPKVDLLGYSENINFKVKTTMAKFWGTFWKFGLPFIPTSGHAGNEDLQTF